MRKIVAVAAMAALLITAQQANASVIYDAGGFDGFSAGNLVGQGDWTSYPTGVTNFAVVDTGTNKYVEVTGTTSSTYAWSDSTFWTPVSGEILSAKISIAAVNAATTAGNNYGFGLDIFGDVGRIGRVGLRVATNGVGYFVTGPYNTVTGQYEAGQTVYNVSYSTGSLTVGAFYNFELQVNFETSTYALLNGSTVLFAAIPFASTGNTVVTDIDFVAVSTATGTAPTAKGAFDNLVVQSVAVPESSSLVWVAPAGLLIGRRRRA